jgi:7-cyano-7-deazaguanine synthase
MRQKAVVLLSGGIDSTTTLAIAINDGYEIYALTFDYGQRHHKEIDAARNIAHYYKVAEHKILRIELDQIGGSALTDRDIIVPKNRRLNEITREIPITYVPARNMILLSYAIAWAETLSADTIFIGANAIDYSGYPDCRPEFFNAFQRVVQLGTKRGVEGHPIALKYPLINLSKGEIIKRGIELDVPYELTWSCYEGQEHPCATCDSCILRAKGFDAAGVPDPLLRSSFDNG